MKVRELLEIHSSADLADALKSVLGDSDTCPLYDEARDLMADGGLSDVDDATEYILNQFKNKVLAGDFNTELKRCVSAAEFEALDDDLYDFIYNGLT